MNFSSRVPDPSVPFGGAPRDLDADAQSASAGFFPPVLLQYWAAVTRRRWIITAIVAACLGLGVILTLLSAPQYTARAQLEITREQKQITNVQGLESADSGQDLEFYATQYSLLVARPVVLRVVRDLRLVNDENFFVSHGISQFLDEDEEIPYPGGNRREKLERLVVETLLENVSINPVRTSRLVDINYTTESPELASRIANAWANAFIAVSMDRQLASTADARRFLEERLDALRDRLEESERRAVTYARNQEIVTLDRQVGESGRTESARTLAESDLDALNTALNQAIAARLAAESRAGSRGENTPESVSSVALANLRSRRADAAAQYARLMVNFNPDYPAARELQEQVGALDAEIARETARISGSRTLEYREALDRERRLRQRVAALKEQLDIQERNKIQLTIFQREADTNRQLYDALLQRYKEIGVAGVVGASNISIVEVAQVPDEPSSPNLVLNILLSLFAGIVIAGAVVFVIEHIDEGIREPSEVKAALNLPLLGQTPMIEADILEELRDTKSHAYEAYFSVQSNLSFATDHGFPKSMMVTSTRPGEGKSSTSVALSSILGRMGKRVILVDGDLRSPSIHEMTGARNAGGLSNYLAGDNNLAGLIQQSSFTNVDVMSAGPMPPSAAELLSGDRLVPLIRQLESEYDHVIIDAPPVLGLSDAPVLSKAVEGCVFVVQHHGAPVRGIRHSIERLWTARAMIFGVVLSQVKASSTRYGYGYGYGDRDDKGTRAAA